MVLKQKVLNSIVLKAVVLVAGYADRTVNDLFDDLCCLATKCPLPECPTGKQNRKGFFKSTLEGGQETTSEQPVLRNPETNFNLWPTSPLTLSTD